jgi:protein SCO1/2
VKKVIPTILWTAVAVIGGFMISRSLLTKQQIVKLPAASSERPPGATIIDVPWKHLPSIERFKLTDQNGDEFDSAKLAGKAYAVSFFFAECPSICRDLNAQVQRLNEQLKNTDITFVSVSVDPDRDTPEILNRYAQDYGATADRWAFLTGPMYQLKQLGEQQFRVVIDRDFHNDNVLLVDKWGRYRDRFKWDDPYDMKRFLKKAKAVAAEKEVPLDETISTRNAMAGHQPSDLNTVPFIREFRLTTSDKETFYSKDMTGNVWIANFFFTACPTICQEQADYLQGLQNRLGKNPTKIVSITTDPATDRPDVLAKYAADHSADPDRWIFCTGESALIPRVGAEFFGAAAKSGQHHASDLFVVDRWGVVRGKFDWQDSAAEAKMLELIDQCWQEKTPNDYLQN